MMQPDGADLTERTCAVDADHDRTRLDKALEILLPDLSLRGRRRIFRVFEALVDGKPRPMSYKVRQGQVLSLAARSSEMAQTPATPPRLLADGAPYLAFFKPAGLHTADLGPGGGPSLEAWAAAHVREPLTLLTRLDFLTSGVVLAARGEEAALAFRAMEDRGEVDKRYACLAWGEMREAAILGRALDTDDRARTRVLSRESLDPLRRTEVRPLAFDPVSKTSLLWAAIKKGARHQIRAHLAAFGHPLVGDPLYGEVRPGPGGESGSAPDGTFAESGLFLAHVLVKFPGFTASCFPEWRGLPGEMEKTLQEAVDAAVKRASERE